MLKYELKKYFSKRMNKTILIVLFATAFVVSFLAVDNISYTDTGVETASGMDKITAGRRLVADKNRWKGELTPEKIADVVDKYQKLKQTHSENISGLEGSTPSYWDILYFAARIYYETEKDVVSADLEHLAEEDIAHIYDIYADNMQDMANEYAKTPEQKKILTEQFSKNKYPLSYEAYDAWNTMAGYAQAYILILVVVLGFLSAGIIDEEFRSHAERVFFSTKYGRTKAVKSKIATGMIATTATYWVAVGILSLVSFGIIGTSGFHTSCRMEDPYIIYDMTQGQRYLLVVVCGYIASLLSASITMLVTAKMHTEVLAVFIPVILYGVLLYFGNPISRLTDIGYFLPYILVNMDRAIRYPVFFQIGKAAFRLIPFVTVLYIIVSVLFLPFIYQSCFRYDAAKNGYREVKKRNNIRL